MVVKTQSNKEKQINLIENGFEKSTNETMIDMAFLHVDTVTAGRAPNTLIKCSTN